jgi:hypothetical protein
MNYSKIFKFSDIQAISNDQIVEGFKVIKCERGIKKLEGSEDINTVFMIFEYEGKLYGNFYILGDTGELAGAYEVEKLDNGEFRTI